MFRAWGLEIKKSSTRQQKMSSTLCANSAKYKQPVEEVLEVDNVTVTPRHLVIRIATQLLPAAAYINDQRFRRLSIRRSKTPPCYLQWTNAKNNKLVLCLLLQQIREEGVTRGDSLYCESLISQSSKKCINYKPRAR